MLLGLLSEGHFLGDFRKISLGLPFALFKKMQVLGDLAKKMPSLGHLGTFGAVVCAKNISIFCTLSAY